MSTVKLKKWSCRPVEFKGQGPHSFSDSSPTLWLCVVYGWVGLPRRLISIGGPLALWLAELAEGLERPPAEGVYTCSGQQVSLVVSPPGFAC